MNITNKNKLRLALVVIGTVVATKAPLAKNIVGPLTDIKLSGSFGVQELLALISLVAIWHIWTGKLWELGGGRRDF